MADECWLTFSQSLFIQQRVGNSIGDPTHAYSSNMIRLLKALAVCMQTWVGFPQAGVILLILCISDDTFRT